MAKNRRQALVGVYEGNPEAAAGIELQLKKYGHGILGIVRSLDDVDRRTAHFLSRNMGYALVGEGLSETEEGGNNIGFVAETIREAAIEAGREVTIIGFSDDGRIKGVDINVPRGGKKPYARLVEQITERQSWG